MLAGNGMTVDTHAKLLPTRYGDDTLVYLPRFGYEFRMPEENERLVYSGRGPTESYRDKCLASHIGVFETTVSEHFEHNIRPQENMAHNETQWVSVSNLTGHGLLALSTGRSFSFNCSHYTTEHLTKIEHDFDLVPIKETVVNIDYAQSGVGSTSCGPALPDALRLQEPEFDFSFRLLPAFFNDVDPFDECGRK